MFTTERMLRLSLGATMVATLLLGGAISAHAQQRLGQFKWALQPFCDVLVLEVAQIGSVFSLNGLDDSCGGPVSATLTGTAVVNKKGSVAFGITFNHAPFASHIWAELDPKSISGPWSDDQGGSGTLVFMGAAGASSAPQGGKPYGE